MLKLFFANWKMYLNDDAAEALARVFLDAVTAAPAVEAAVAPSFTALERVSRVLHASPVALGAQDVSWAEAGAHTGQVSTSQLTALGARYVILGHSERRAELGETDEMVAKKAAAAQAAGLTPVICVGETKEEWETGRQQAVIKAQIEGALKGLAFAPGKNVIVAYEPRWAIGTGVACRVEDVVVMHGLIRTTVVGLAGNEALEHLRVLYGGSVDPKNIGEYLASPAVDGALVGGASTRPDDVRGLIEAFAR